MSSPIASERYECPTCLLRFRHIAAFRRHIQDHEGKKRESSYNGNMGDLEL